MFFQRSPRLLVYKSGSRWRAVTVSSRPGAELKQIPALTHRLPSCTTITSLHPPVSHKLREAGLLTQQPASFSLSLLKYNSGVIWDLKSCCWGWCVLNPKISTWWDLPLIVIFVSIQTTWKLQRQQWYASRVTDTCLVQLQEIKKQPTAKSQNSNSIYYIKWMILSFLCTLLSPL